MHTGGITIGGGYRWRRSVAAIGGGYRWRRSVAAIGGLLAWRDPIALMQPECITREGFCPRRKMCIGGGDTTDLMRPMRSDNLDAADVHQPRKVLPAPEICIGGRDPGS
jgi:hypothetical protein